jgi:hypothetical protein
MKGGDKAKQSADAWIIPALGKTEVAKLTRKRIETWLDSVANSPKRVRAKAGHAEAYALPPRTDDEKRERKDTANRILTTLKAALTFALDRGMLSNELIRPLRLPCPFDEQAMMAAPRRRAS